MIGDFFTAIFSKRWNGKYFSGWNFYLDILQIQENWAGRNFITNLHVYSLLITQAKMQTTQQQLTDGRILANRNSANHPYCFLSNQKKVQILAFLYVICERNVSCRPPENRLHRDKAGGHDHRLVTHCTAKLAEFAFVSNRRCKEIAILICLKER